MEMTIDIGEVKRLVEDGDLVDWLFNHTVNFSTVAFVIQVLSDKIDELENS